MFTVYVPIINISTPIDICHKLIFASSPILVSNCFIRNLLFHSHRANFMAQNADHTDN